MQWLQPSKGMRSAINSALPHGPQGVKFQTAEDIIKMQKKDTQFGFMNFPSRTHFAQPVKLMAQINADVQKSTYKTMVQVLSHMTSDRCPFSLPNQ